MPAPNAGLVHTQTKEGVAGFLFAKLATQQTANIAASDHMKFDTVVASRGGDIVLDTTTAYATVNGAASIGRLTLKANKTYRLRAQIPYFLASGATGLLEFGFFDATAGADLPGSTRGSLLVATTATNDIGGGFAEAVFTPGVDTLVELRFYTATAITQFGITNTRQPTLFVDMI